MSENPYTPKRQYFDEGNTRAYEFRIEELKKLKGSIKRYEDDILQALFHDLNKASFESFTAEVGMIYQEINIALKILDKWMKPRRVSTPVYLQPGTSYIYPEPKGVVLIISPWNYPFQLAISPLIGAIAGGNCAVLKPSRQSREVERIIEKLISETFSHEYISVVTGSGSQVVTPLIENYRFDHIFFTGSIEAGKDIMSLAAKQLTPVTLELGGKSPVIVHEDADIDLAAKRITWAKFYNCGQTCIAPDYLLVHESQKNALIDRIKYYINKYYGDNPIESNSFGRIINEKRFDRLMFLLEESNITFGGDFIRDKRYISPTLVDHVDIRDPLMNEEIFGPILPILTYKEVYEILDIVRENPYPLALYLFTRDKEIENYILNNISFGGGCINHLITHVANSNLPFGGIGFSGMGRYHSKYSFDTFSNEKSIFKSKGKLDSNILYPPYTDKKLKLAKKFL